MWKVRDFSAPPTRRVSGIIGAVAPSRPWIPAERSCSKAPIGTPRLAILNELYWFEMTVTISELAIGSEIGPRPRRG
jgi:hypothetical protein